MTKKQESTALLNAALYILIGALLCIFRASVLEWAMTGIGAVLCAIGVLTAIRGALAEGVITAAIGVLIILGGWMFVDIILLILGIVLLAKGILDLVRVLPYRILPAIVGSVFTIAVGVLLIVSKWALLDWFFIIIGLLLIFDGVLMALGKKR